MKLERLYKTAKSGATQVFDIEVSGDTYTVTWGQRDGKMQTKSTTCKPKNVGKANETTAEEQAVLEAKAVWVKKQKSNYSTSEEAPVTVKLPMKVNEYQKHKSKVKFPCYTSPKLNGVNAEYRLVDGKLVLLSRGGEEYPIPEHQRADILKVMEALTTESINGEMYIHEEFLQDIMAATKKHNEMTPRLQFWAFDFPELDGDYASRCSYAYGVGEKLEGVSSVKFVSVGVAHSHDDIEDQWDFVTEANYEGLIIRNATGKYEYNTRSYDVLKYKQAQDSEFKVVGYSLDKNGHAVFVAETGLEDLGAKSTFKVKLKGTAEERLAMAAEADKYIGQWLKVEYEMLSKDGIPQKPVGIMFRKVDENGEAIE